jgi:hypothetical protein
LRQSFVPSLRSAQRQNTWLPGVQTGEPLLDEVVPGSELGVPLVGLPELLFPAPLALLLPCESSDCGAMAPPHATRVEAVESTRQRW